MIIPVAPLTKQQERLIQNLVELYANNVKNPSKVLVEGKILHLQVLNDEMILI